MKRLILLMLLASPASAQVTPNFTQGSMQSTTTTTVDVNRAAGIIEDSLVTESIQQVSTTTSLSVFSQ